MLCLAKPSSPNGRGAAGAVCAAAIIPSSRALGRVYHGQRKGSPSALFITRLFLSFNQNARKKKDSGLELGANADHEVVSKVDGGEEKYRIRGG